MGCRGGAGMGTRRSEGREVPLEVLGGAHVIASRLRLAEQGGMRVGETYGSRGRLREGTPQVIIAGGPGITYTFTHLVKGHIECPRFLERGLKLSVHLWLRVSCMPAAGPWMSLCLP